MDFPTVETIKNSESALRETAQKHAKECEPNLKFAQENFDTLKDYAKAKAEASLARMITGKEPAQLYTLLSKKQNAAYSTHFVMELLDIIIPNDVNLISTGYEWVCPSCTAPYKANAPREFVECPTCEMDFQTHIMHPEG
jgi:rubrerythrin